MDEVNERLEAYEVSPGGEEDTWLVFVFVTAATDHEVVQLSSDYAVRTCSMMPASLI